MSSKTTISFPLLFASILVGVFFLFCTATTGIEAATTEYRIFNCPLQDNVTIDDCDIGSYALTIVMTFIPGVLMAIFTLFFIPFFFIARYCCGCCGGNRQTEGCCCAGKGCCCCCDCGGGEPARYSYFEIVRTKVYALICLVFACVALGYSVGSAAQGRQGLTGLLAEVARVPKILVNELDIAGDKLTMEIYNSTTDSYDTLRLLDSNQDLNNTIRNITNSMEAAVKDGTASFESLLDIVMIVLFVIVLIPAVLMGINFVFGIFNIRRYGPMLLAFFLLFFLIILWLAHATTSVITLVTSDVCAEIEGLGKQEKNIVTALVNCPTDLLDKARTEFRNLEIDQSKGACVKMNATCVIPGVGAIEFATNAADGKVFDCPTGFLDCENATFARLLNYSENSMTLNSGVSALPGASANGLICRDTAASNCTLAVCADTCTKSDGTKSTVGKSAQVAMSAFRAAAKVAEIFADYGARFYVCEGLFALITGEMVPHCNGLQEALFNGRMATGVEAVFCVFAVFVCCYGSKRYIPFEEAGQYQDEEMKDDMAREDEMRAKSDVIESVN